MTVRACVTIASAQRLSASQISSRSRWCGCMTATPCAQRLSASQISSPQTAQMRGLAIGVLNAFRHHRSHHPAPPTGSPDTSSAQRLSASQISSRHVGGLLPRHQCVLNAFRHHRSHHGGWAWFAYTPWGQCSTPFGITDLITGRKTGATGTAYGCSTPFGITDLITTFLLASFLLLCWCSTPFGITDLITTPVNDMVPTVACAQRLSASQISSLSAAETNKSKRHVLNAFRHHRSHHSPPSPR